MASQENLVKLVHKATGHTYWTRKNRKKLAQVKLKLKKFNPILRARVDYVETKK
jgi:ribosomal protein L33